MAGDALRVGGGEDEHDVGRRLLERLEERVEGRAREHVHLVDDVDLEAAARRARSFTFSRSVRMSSMLVLEAASISITSIGAPETKSTQEGHLPQARRPRAPRSRAPCARSRAVVVLPTPRGPQKR